MLKGMLLLEEIWPHSSLKSQQRPTDPGQLQKLLYCPWYLEEQVGETLLNREQAGVQPEEQGHQHWQRPEGQMGSCQHSAGSDHRWSFLLASHRTYLDKQKCNKIVGFVPSFKWIISFKWIGISVNKCIPCVHSFMKIKKSHWLNIFESLAFKYYQNYQT